MVATTLNSEHRGLTWAGSVGLGWALAWAALIDFQARTSRKQTLRAPSQYHLSCWKAKWLYDEVRKGVLTEQLILDKCTSILNIVRDTNNTLRWFLLQRRTRNKGMLALVIDGVWPVGDLSSKRDDGSLKGFAKPLLIRRFSCSFFFLWETFDEIHFGDFQ